MLSCANGDVATVSNRAMPRAPTPISCSVTGSSWNTSSSEGSDRMRAEDREPQQHLGHRLARDARRRASRAATMADAGADLAEHAEERLVEAQHVDGEPGVAVADAGHGAEGEDDDGGKGDAHAGGVVDLLRHAGQHPDHHGHRDDEDDLLAVGDAARAPSTVTTAPKTMPPPRMRQSIGAALAGLEPHEQGAGDGDQRGRSGRAGTPCRRRDTAPAIRRGRRRRRCRTTAPAGRAPAPCRGRGRSPASGAGVPSGLVRGTTSVLMASATTSCSTTPVTLISEAMTKMLVGGQHRDPAAGGARQQDEDEGDQAGADEHVGAPLRAEQRHGVDQSRRTPS